MLKRFSQYIFLLLFLVLSTQVFSQKQYRFSQENTSLQVMEDSWNQLIIRNLIGEINIVRVKTSQGLFNDLALKDYSWSHQYGSPKLPVISKVIEIPQDAKVQVEVVSSNYTEYDSKTLGFEYQLLPSQLPVPKDPALVPPFQFNQQVYQTDAYYGLQLANIEEFGTMRGMRLARVNIAPFQYNPVTGKFLVYNDVIVKIRFISPGIEKTNQLKQRVFSPYFESLNSLILNPKPLALTGSTANITRYPVKYVIVADTMFATALNPFIKWKTKKGFKVITAFTSNPSVGNTTTSIKNYLSGLYNSATTNDPAPSFVLFVGDVAQIPAFFIPGGTSHYTDLYYCEYTGDTLPDVFYGRFSATNVSQLTAQISKTLYYEQYQIAEPGYLNNAVLIAGYDGSLSPVYANGQISYLANTYFNAMHSISSATFMHPAASGQASQIREEVSNGACIVNYTAHGGIDGWSDPAFKNSHVPAMTNAGKYPLMIGNACLTNKFDASECFGEAVMRAENKGAIGYIGGSDNTYWDEDYWWAVGFGTVVPNPTFSTTGPGAFDRLFHDHGELFNDWFVSQGQMIFAGNLAVMQGASLADIKYYWEIYHLMGDPSLVPYVSVPQTLTATYDMAIPIALNTINVMTEPYAYVGITMNDSIISTPGSIPQKNSQTLKFHGAALADSTGLAVVSLDTFLFAGTANIVVTKQNYKPFFGTFNVINPTGPYLVYSQHSFKDSLGNNNGKADFGETVFMDVTIKNITSFNAHKVNILLKSNDYNVDIIDSLKLINDVAAYNSISLNNAFSFKINNLVEDLHKVNFTLQMTDSIGNSWSSVFSFVLNAPQLQVSNYSLNDSAANGNGHPDPDETFLLTFPVSNSGHADAVNTIATLTSSNPKIQVLNSTVNLNTLNENTTQNVVFQIHADNNAWKGTVSDFVFGVQSGAYSVQKSFKIMIGKVDEDFETGNFTKFNWVQSADGWSISDSNVFQGTYSAKSDTISDNQSASLTIDYNVLSDDSISFYIKVSSELNWDFLRFYVDNSLIDEWSGVVDWKRVAYLIKEGQHTFKWSYEKDNGFIEGSDCSWLDFISFPATSLFAGIEPQQPVAGQELRVFPNPAPDQLNIVFTTGTEAKASLKLFDELGQIVYQSFENKLLSNGNHSFTIPVSQLHNGFYFLVISSDQYQIRKKVIVSH